jgi:2-methylcitrate dehydratase PrpD
MVLNPSLPEPADAQRLAAAEGLRTLCQWAVSAAKSPLSESVRRRAALVLTDDFAAVVAASVEPQVTRAQEILLAPGGRSEATVFGSAKRKGTREQAAAANGIAITWAELDEGYRALPCHAGAYVLPALLAEAESADHSVADVLRALAIGYEITARIAKSYPFHRLSVHPHAAFNAIGAAAGLAILRGYDTDLFVDTITAASTLVNPGPFNHAIEGALVRNVWTCIGASAGFRAADFAPLGVAGLAGALHDVFVDGFGCLSHPEELIVDLGNAWSIEGGYHKIYACCQYTHSAVQASITLAEELKQRPGRSLERIRVETHARGLALNVRAPSTVLAGKFSMPHAMATVAVHGDAEPRSFNAASLENPEVTKLRAAVELIPHPAVGAWPNDRPAIVHWHLDDGSELTASVESARGGSDQPFEEWELLAKFDRLLSPIFPEASPEIEKLVVGSIDGNGSWSNFVSRVTS